MEDAAMPEATRTLTIESISAFNGLDVLVAIDEGLFAAEGLDVIISRPRSGARSLSGAVDRGTLVQPASNQGQLLNQHAADLFQG
jgi:ABC-type nitrate/sulfonate/bicarbonate transport system substrate-binding protein